MVATLAARRAPLPPAGVAAHRAGEMRDVEHRPTIVDSATRPEGDAARVRGVSVAPARMPATENALAISW